jgi:hypothetical protein
MKTVYRWHGALQGRRSNIKTKRSLILCGAGIPKEVQLKFIAVASTAVTGIGDDDTPNEKCLKFHEASHAFIVYPISALTAPQDYRNASSYIRVDRSCQLFHSPQNSLPSLLSSRVLISAEFASPVI